MKNLSTVILICVLATTAALAQRSTPALLGSQDMSVGRCGGRPELSIHDLVSFRLSYNAPAQQWDGTVDDQNGWFVQAVVPPGKRLVLKAITFGRDMGNPVQSGTGLTGITNIALPASIANHAIYWQIDNGDLLEGTVFETGTSFSAGQQQEQWVVGWLVDA